MKINMGVPRADMPKLLTGKDFIFMAPGSTVAELAAIKGYKPKVIAFKKQHEILGPQGQFESNPKWYRKAVGGIESIDVHKITGDKIVDGLNSVEKQTVNSEPIHMQTSDVLKIKNTVRADTEVAKVFTKNLKTSGKFALGAGIGALVTNRLHKFITDRN